MGSPHAMGQVHVTGRIVCVCALSQSRLNQSWLDQSESAQSGLTIPVPHSPCILSTLPFTHPILRTSTTLGHPIHRWFAHPTPLTALIIHPIQTQTLRPLPPLTLHLTYPSSHLPCLLLTLPVTHPASHHPCISFTLSLTIPASHPLTDIHRLTQTH